MIRTGLSIDPASMLLVISVDILLVTIKHNRLPHVVWILVKLAPFVVAARALAAASIHSHVYLRILLSLHLVLLLIQILLLWLLLCSVNRA